MPILQAWLKYTKHRYPFEIFISSVTYFEEKKGVAQEEGFSIQLVLLNLIPQIIFT